MSGMILVRRRRAALLLALLTGACASVPDLGAMPEPRTVPALRRCRCALP